MLLPIGHETKLVDGILLSCIDVYKAKGPGGDIPVLILGTVSKATPLEQCTNQKTIKSFHKFRKTEKLNNQRAMVAEFGKIDFSFKRSLARSVFGRMVEKSGKTLQ
jgi:hypothetical protein